MATTMQSRPQAAPTTVSVKLYRIAAVRNPDGLGGSHPQEVSMVLTAESMPQLNAMVNVAAIDGWHRKGKSA